MALNGVIAALKQRKKRKKKRERAREFEDRIRKIEEEVQEFKKISLGIEFKRGRERR